VEGVSAVTHNLYDDEDDDEDGKYIRPDDNRCTPDKLLDFITGLGRMPTLSECRQRFGGILGVFVDSWLLQSQGRWPKHLESARRRRRHGA
jgi:hypothetical protein